MNDWPPDSQECIFIGRAMASVSASELWPKLISGEVIARVYRVGCSDFAPIPISPHEFLNVDRDETLQRFQIDVRDIDRRRSARMRPRIPVPHWIYLVRSTLPKSEAKRGAPDEYDWAELQMVFDDLMKKYGDYEIADNRVKDWRSQNDVIRKLEDYLEKHKRPVPGPSQMKVKVAEFLKNWRGR